MKANFGELTFHVLRCISLFTPLRRLMRNCEERRRSQDRMLVHQTLSKGWCHARSRLLLGLIVRARGRLVEAQARFGTTESRSSGSAQRSGGPHPDHPRPVAPLQKRARFLALRSRTSALLLPEPLFPEPAQPEGALCGARVARLAAWSGPRAPWCFGGLPCPGHYSHPGHREGKSFSQGAVCRASHLREERLQNRVGLRFQGGTFGQPRGRDLRLRAGGGSLRRAPIADFLIIEDFHDAYLADKGFTGVEWERRWLDLYGALVAATSKNDSKRAWAKTDRRWASGKRQIIEGVIDQLKDLFALERHKAKTLGGLLARLAAKMAAYTCGQKHNDQLRRPERH